MRPPPRLRTPLPATLLALLASPFLHSCGIGGAGYRYDPARAIHPQFSADRAFQHVEAQVAFGPRPSGSQASKRTADYLEGNLRASGWIVRRQEFTEQTPLGPIPFVNLRARFPDGRDDASTWKQTVAVLVGSHYDTKHFRDVHFVGANDGASSTGVLLEMARVLAARAVVARQLELVFFDGEEAIQEFTATDGIYGSRHYAENVIRRQPGRERPKAVVVLDLVGEESLHVQIPSDTPARLRAALFAAARDLGYSSSFGVSQNPITDDHVPFQNEGVPAIDIIDLDYDAWHTSRDTLSRISWESLAISGKTALLMIEKYLLSP